MLILYLDGLSLINVLRHKYSWLLEALLAVMHWTVGRILQGCAHRVPYCLFEPLQVRRFPAGDLHTEQLHPRTGLPPLLCRLSDRPPEQLQWLGVSYGLTQPLYNFWSRSAFSPVYLRQAPSEITGSRITRLSGSGCAVQLQRSSNADICMQKRD